MKVIEVPVFNPDGSVKVTHLVSADEAQVLLQFALNMLTTVGLVASKIQNSAFDPDNDEDNPPFDPTLNS